MRYVATLLFVMTNFAVYGLLSQLRWREGQLFYILITGLLCFLVILVHECGHALAARFYGRPVLRFVAMPFELRFRPLRFRMAHRDPIGADIGGFVQYGGGQETRRERIVIAFAGPAANFVLAAVALALVAWLSMRTAASNLPPLIPIDPVAAGLPPSGPPAMLPSDDEVRRILAGPNPYFSGKRVGTILAEALAALSVGTGIANLIPFRGSDGDLIFDALFSGRSQA